MSKHFILFLFLVPSDSEGFLHTLIRSLSAPGRVWFPVTFGPSTQRRVTPEHRLTNAGCGDRLVRPLGLSALLSSTLPMLRIRGIQATQLIELSSVTVLNANCSKHCGSTSSCSTGHGIPVTTVMVGWSDSAGYREGSQKENHKLRSLEL